MTEWYSVIGQDEPVKPILPHESFFAQEKLQNGMVSSNHKPPSSSNDLSNTFWDTITEERKRKNRATSKRSGKSVISNYVSSNVYVISIISVSIIVILVIMWLINRFNDNKKRRESVFRSIECLSPEYAECGNFDALLSKKTGNVAKKKCHWKNDIFSIKSQTFGFDENPCVDLGPVPMAFTKCVQNKMKFQYETMNVTQGLQGNNNDWMNIEVELYLITIQMKEKRNIENTGIMIGIDNVPIINPLEDWTDIYSPKRVMASNFSLDRLLSIDTSDAKYYMKKCIEEDYIESLWSTHTINSFIVQNNAKINKVSNAMDVSLYFPLQNLVSMRMKLMANIARLLKSFGLLISHFGGSTNNSALILPSLNKLPQEMRILCQSIIDDSLQNFKSKSRDVTQKRLSSYAFHRRADTVDTTQSLKNSEKIKTMKVTVNELITLCIKSPYDQKLWWKKRR